MEEEIYFNHPDKDRKATVDGSPSPGLHQSQKKIFHFFFWGIVGFEWKQSIRTMFYYIFSNIFKSFSSGEHITNRRQKDRRTLCLTLGLERGLTQIILQMRKFLKITKSLILTRVARDWCIYASAQTLVGPQRFISGAICPSTPFERYRRFTSPSNELESQNFWFLSNTDAPVYVYRRAIFPALRERSSEREKKLSNRLAASSFFQSFRCDRRRLSPISLLICQIYQMILNLIEATWTLHMTCPHARW